MCLSGGDSGRLVRILGNLLSNAVKFTRTGYIHVGASYGNGRLLLFVRDTGTGIDKERQQLIFSDFEQAGFPTDGGFGLGLAVTSRLVSLARGRHPCGEYAGTWKHFRGPAPPR